jgi:hypothetical protein
VHPKVAKTKSHVVLLGISTLGALLPRAACGQQATSGRDHIPVGWYEYPSDKLENLDEASKQCFSFSRNDWHVMVDGSDVTFEKRLRQDNAAAPALPPLLKPENGMPGRNVSDGLRTAIHYRDGWLLAYDGGEWGGGLWLTNEDGSRTKRIVDSNVRAVVAIDSGILVLSGLAHLTMNFGNASIFSNPSGLDISLQHTTQLDGMPSAPTKAPDGSVLFVTTDGLYKVTKIGELQRLANLPKWTRHQSPDSMAIAANGTIFVGMRMFVLQIRPDAGYSFELLLPNECRRFELQQFDCVCKP